MILHQRMACLFFLFLLWQCAIAQEENNKSEEPEETIGIIQKLGDDLDLDLDFIDENGNTINLKELVDKPTILNLVYYRCPGICSPLLNELQRVIQMTKAVPGKDFQIVSISIDPTETHEIAKDKKKNYLNGMKGNAHTMPFPDNAWHFLTGKQENITKIANATGFKYKKDEKVGYLHATALIFLSPQGKIVRYVMGLEFLPLDFQMAILEASEGRVGPTIAKLIRFCFSRDPKNREYALNITRVAGIIIMFMAFCLALFVTLFRRQKKVEINNQAIT